LPDVAADFFATLAVALLVAFGAAAFAGLLAAVPAVLAALDLGDFDAAALRAGAFFAETLVVVFATVRPS
jgi:hypothetical protein